MLEVESVQRLPLRLLRLHPDRQEHKALLEQQRTGLLPVATYSICTTKRIPSLRKYLDSHQVEEDLVYS